MLTITFGYDLLVFAYVIHLSYVVTYIYIVPKGPVGNKAALVLVTSWPRIADASTEIKVGTDQWRHLASLGHKTSAHVYTTGHISMERLRET